MVDYGAKNAPIPPTFYPFSKNGICFIYFGGRDPDSLEQTLKQFKYSYSFSYWLNNTWSIIASDSPFDLAEVLKANSYLDYMGNHVICQKSNLTISLNYEEKALEIHLKSSDTNHIKFFLDEFNPFAKQKFIDLNNVLNDIISERDASNSDKQTYTKKS